MWCGGGEGEGLVVSVWKGECSLWSVVDASGEYAKCAEIVKCIGCSPGRGKGSAGSGECDVCIGSIECGISVEGRNYSAWVECVNYNF
jgi:hypothetical protein